MTACFYIAVSLPICAQASPWPRGDNRLFVATNAEFFIATDDFLPSTPDEATDSYKRYDLKTYAEFGLTDQITLGGTVIYSQSTISNRFEARQASGFSQIEAFAQHQLWASAKSVGAVRVTGGVPTRFETGLRPNIETDGAVAELRFLYGRNIALKPFKIFASAEAGYRKRFGDAADFGQVDITVGVEPTDKFLLLLQSYNAKSIGNAADDGVSFDLYKISPSIVWRLRKRWAIQAGATFEYAGQNVQRGNTYFLGLWSSF